MKMISKKPKYYCGNCKTAFKTGRFSKKDSKLYDNICPNCGAPATDFIGLICDLEDIADDLKFTEKQHKELFEKYKTVVAERNELGEDVLELTKQLAAAQQRAQDLQERIDEQRFGSPLPIGSPYREEPDKPKFDKYFKPFCEVEE